ncbi:hypothetical protein AAHK14_02595 [Moraxella sp. K1664]|uniref:hypothetical protein n=1 Tax=Moraxella sp. K1664 TaxID=2780077 RepID=UPI003216C023
MPSITFDSLEVPLANSQENILDAIKKLENVGCVTEFDEILNGFPMGHWKEYYLDVLKNNGYTGVNRTPKVRHTNLWGAFYGKIHNRL